MERGRRNRSPARSGDAAVQHSIAKLHSVAHARAGGAKAPALTLAGEFSGPVLHHAPGNGELCFVVFNSSSYAIHAIPERIAGSVAALGARSLNEILKEVTSFVRDAAATFLGVDAATGHAAPRSGLTDVERRALTEGGVDVAAGVPAGPQSATARTQAEFRKLLLDSWSVGQAARLLDVDASRIRQRLGGRPRSLFGIKMGRNWRVPRFQFDRKRLVPGIDQVAAALPADLSPVAVYRWFTTPNSELELDEVPVTPLDWLKAGNAPVRAAELAAALA